MRGNAPPHRSRSRTRTVARSGPARSPNGTIAHRACVVADAFTVAVAQCWRVPAPGVLLQNQIREKESESR